MTSTATTWSSATTTSASSAPNLGVDIALREEPPQAALRVYGWLRARGDAVTGGDSVIMVGEGMWTFGFSDRSRR